MDILAPIDGSDCSFRALEFAAEMAKRYDGSLHVVHFSDEETEATDTIRERARKVLDGEGVDADPEVETDVDIEFQPGNRVGDAILDLVAEHHYDHVVMGHHGSSTVERAILGSAAETVLRSERVPVTVIP
jgi:nucleotide-binding universal stress UspA family protein